MSAHSAGEVRFLDCLYEARHELRQLMERWDNRLTFENLSLVEKYLEGRLTLVCDVELGSGSYWRVELSALSNNQSHALKNIVVVVDEVNVSEGDSGDNGHQSEMFVHNVGVVQS